MSTYFGLDLGSSSIKVMQASPMGKSIMVEGVGIIQNPVGNLNLDDKVGVQKIGDSIKKVLSESHIGVKRAVVSIPESRVFSRIVEMPNMSEAELTSAVSWEAEQFVPMPVAEVEIDYVVLKRPAKGSNQKMLVYLVAAPKKYLQSLVDLMVGVGIEPIAVESEMIAVARSLTFNRTAGAKLIFHMGALSSVIAIVENDNLLFSYVEESGGVALTRAIAQTINLPIGQAEEYKRTYGMSDAQLEGKVKQALLLVMEGLSGEIKKAAEFYMTKYHKNIQTVVLSGGGAYLPELSSYISGVFGGVEVSIGDPLAFAKPARNVVLPKERAVYSVAAGLALRPF